MELDGTRNYTKMSVLLDAFAGIVVDLVWASLPRSRLRTSLAPESDGIVCGGIARRRRSSFAMSALGLRHTRWKIMYLVDV